MDDRLHRRSLKGEATVPDPISYHLLEADKEAAVREDGLPRVARYRTEYDDSTKGETLHVLFLNEVNIVQSMTVDEWAAQGKAVPSSPTRVESAAAIRARNQAVQQAQSDHTALRQRMLFNLKPLEGVPFGDLSPSQLKDVVEALMWRLGALNKDTTIKPAVDWLDRPTR